MTDFLIRLAFTALCLAFFAGYLVFSLNRQFRARAAARERFYADRLADFDRRATEWHADQEKVEAAWSARYAEILRDIGPPADEPAPAGDTRP